MKITSDNEGPVNEEGTYRLEVSGVELLAIWQHSYSAEGAGEATGRIDLRAPRKIDDDCYNDSNRICHQIQLALGASYTAMENQADALGERLEDERKQIEENQ